MHKIVISDTSCLIILSKINELELLQKLYSEIITIPEIAEEFEEILPTWIKIVQVKDKQKQLLLEMQIDRGESSAIALALETENSILILDDFKARKLVEKLSLNFTGTLGVIIKAKQNGIVNSVKPILHRIKETNFRISEELEKEILFLAEEN